MASERAGYRAPRHAIGADHGTAHDKLHAPGPSPARPPKPKGFKPRMDEPSDSAGGAMPEPEPPADVGGQAPDAPDDEED